MTEPKQASSMSRDIVVVAVVAILALMLGVNLFMWIDDGEGVFPGTLVGQEAPNFELPVMGGEETVSLDSLRGMVVVMDFWATWCPPCRDQMPELEEVANDPDLADDIVVLSINTDPDGPDRMEAVQRFLDEEDLSLPTLVDTGQVRSAYRVGTIPTLVIIDPSGVVTTVSAGVHDAQKLRRLIEEAADGG